MTAELCGARLLDEPPKFGREFANVSLPPFQIVRRILAILRRGRISVGCLNDTNRDFITDAQRLLAPAGVSAYVLALTHKPADLKGHFVGFGVRVTFGSQSFEFLWTPRHPIDDGGQHSEFTNASDADSLAVAIDLERNHWRHLLDSRCFVNIVG